MTIAVSDVIAKASTVLQDASYVRWPLIELYKWINEAAKSIVVRRPDAGAATVNFTLVAGTKQALPATTFRLLDITRNMGNGTQPGLPLNQTDRKSLDQALPAWHSSTPAAVTTQYTYEPSLDPRVFYTYPPAISGNKLEIVYSAFPAAITDVGDSVAMDGEYEEAMVNYVLYRALSKDSEYANAQMATLHYTAFMSSLGMDKGAAA